MSGKGAARLDSLAAAAMILAAGTMTALAVLTYLRFPPARAQAPSPESRSEPPALPSAARSLIGESLHLDDAAIDGVETARVGMVLFTDLECPFCRAFATKTLPAVREAYVTKGLAFIALRHVPITRLHPGALSLAHAVECARGSGKAWKLHDRIVAGPAAGTRNIVHLAAEFGLDRERFEGCLDAEGPAAVRKDLALARDLGITGTPTVLYGVGGRGVLRVTDVGTGAEPFQVVSKRLDDALAAAGRLIQ